MTENSTTVDIRAVFVTCLLQTGIFISSLCLPYVGQKINPKNGKTILVPKWDERKILVLQKYARRTMDVDVIFTSTTLFEKDPSDFSLFVRMIFENDPLVVGEGISLRSWRHFGAHSNLFLLNV